MFFGMAVHKEYGVDHHHRVGKMSKSFEKVKAAVIPRKGYVVNESGEMVGQAFDATLPRYIGPTDVGTVQVALKNISSGEDCFV